MTDHKHSGAPIVVIGAGIIGLQQAAALLDHGHQVVLIEREQGIAVPDLCRAHGMSSASFYKWRAKYGGMDAAMLSQLEAL